GFDLAALLARQRAYAFVPDVEDAGSVLPERSRSGHDHGAHDAVVPAKGSAFACNSAPLADRELPFAAPANLKFAIHIPGRFGTRNNDLAVRACAVADSTRLARYTPARLDAQRSLALVADVQSAGNAHLAAIGDGKVSFAVAVPAADIETAKRPSRTGARYDDLAYRACSVADSRVSVG